MNIDNNDIAFIALITMGKSTSLRNHLIRNWIENNSQNFMTQKLIDIIPNIATINHQMLTNLFTNEIDFMVPG